MFLPMLSSTETCSSLTGMYADAALSTADQPAGPVLCYMRVRQLSLPAVIHLAGLSVEAHFRDEWLGPLAAPWTVHQHHAGTPAIRLGLEGKRVQELVRTLFHTFLI